MEFVALSDTVLQALALDDPQLRRVFQGVYPAEKLPQSPTKTVRAAYIVNTDPAGEPGQHWLGLWKEQNKCEIFDSYGLPLHVHKDPELHQWWSQWNYLTRSDITLQATDSQTCGQYVLFFLKARAQGQTYEDFLGRCCTNNLVVNDHKVAQDLRRVIKRELQDEVDAPPEGQSNVSRRAFILYNKSSWCENKKHDILVHPIVCG